VVQLQPRNNPLNEDAALVSRYVVGGGPDGPKLRISEREHAAMVFGESGPLMAEADERARQRRTNSGSLAMLASIRRASAGCTQGAAFK
jgi:hypothetical protein